MDLDQAHAPRAAGSGFRVRYAIADVAAFVRPGGLIDAEAHRRVERLPSPDTRTPLRPPVLSEGAASLLPQPVPPGRAVDAGPGRRRRGDRVDVRRAMVRSRDRLDYAGCRTSWTQGKADERLQLLAEFGELRIALEVERGGVSLPIPEQEVVEDGETFTLEYRVTRRVE